MRVKEPGEIDPPASVFKYLRAVIARGNLRNRVMQWASPLEYDDKEDVQWNLGHSLLEPAALPIIEQSAIEIFDDPANHPVEAPELQDLYDFLKGLYATSKSDFREALSTLPTFLATKVIPGAFEDQTVPQLRQLRLLCLSEVSDSDYLWENYAQKWAGVVLDFDCAELMKSVECGCVKVEYMDRYPDMLDIHAWGKTGILGRKGYFRDDTKIIAIKTKRKLFEKEQEIRLFADNGHDPNVPKPLIPFPVAALRGVILGKNIDPNDAAAIRALISGYYPSAYVRQA